MKSAREIRSMIMAYVVDRYVRHGEDSSVDEICAALEILVQDVHLAILDECRVMPGLLSRIVIRRMPGGSRVQARVYHPSLVCLSRLRALEVV